MVRYKVAAVSYLNTIPFIHGIKSSNIYDSIDLRLDYPSVCAQKLIDHEVDIALVPVAVLKQNPSFNIVSDFCIGADGEVDTVCLYSNVPLEEIEHLLLDYQSRTSVELLRILCERFWEISPVFKPSYIGFESNIRNKTAALIIGDRAFNVNGKYKFEYDLSHVWKQMTGLPFVFACWISNKNIDQSFLSEFNYALKSGLSEIEKAVEIEKHNFPHCNNPNDYLNNKISYILDEEKRKGMRTFLSMII